MHELDHKFEMQGREVAIIVDNCPANPDISGLKAINLPFLSPNTTSCTEPMDQVCLLYYFFILLTKSIDSQSIVQTLL